MTKLNMKKIEIAALMENRKKIVELLQRRGTIEFCDCRDDAIIKMNTASSISQFEKGIVTANQAKTVLNEYVPAKTTLLSAMKGRREIEKHDFGKLVEQRDVFMKYCYDILNAQKNISDNRAAIARTITLMDALRIWMDLDVPMQCKGTKYSRCLIGSVPRKITAEELLEELAGMVPGLEAVDVEIVSTYKEQTFMAVFCHVSVAEAVNLALREIGFAAVSDPVRQTPKEKLRQYAEDLNTCEEAIQKNIDTICSFSDKKSEIEFLIDYLVIRKEKYEALSKIALTKNTFLISGYIPEKYVEKCVRELESKFIITINVSAPDEEEEVPVLFENPSYISAVEPVTAMYGMPGKRDVDPNPYMAFFYYFFFGIMLSDAGYGVIMVIVSLIALKKFKLKDSMKKTFRMFLYCGISTIFWGAMFGTWFGDIIPILYQQFGNANPPDLALWFNPINNPIQFLLASFAFGMVHLFVGLAINFKMSWSEGRKMDAVLDVIPVYLLVLGAAPLAAGVLVSIPALFSTIGKYMALAGIVLIVLTSGRSSKNIFARLGGGLYSLYNIASGYLSDILSYSRLLALGLATGSIGGIVNLIGSMTENPILKAVMLPVVFVVGHTLNMAINLLGAYVHTNRLQFVEFFSKFYDGGGRAFDPLKVNSSYIEFKEEPSLLNQ